MAKQFVSGGLAECVLALGFEKMEKFVVFDSLVLSYLILSYLSFLFLYLSSRGSLGSKFQDRTNPMDKHMMRMMEEYDFTPAPPAAQMFGNAGRDHMKKYGTKPETFAKIAYKVCGGWVVVFDKKIF